MRVEDTPAGPVLDQTWLKQQFVVVWSGLWPESTDLGLGELAWATDLDQGIALARLAGAMPLNLHLAHRSGATVQMVTGRVPERVDGQLVQGRFLDPQSIPVVRSGSAGWLVSANDRRRGDTLDLPAGWNHAPGFRARRIRQLLAQGGDWTEHRVFAMQHDVRSEMLDFYRDLAIEALERARDNGSEAHATDIERALSAWNGTIDSDSVGVPLLMRFRSQLRARLLKPLVTACVRAEPKFVFSWRGTESFVRTLVATRDARLLAGPSAADWWHRVADVLFAAASELARHGERLSDLRWGDVASRALVPLRARGRYHALSRGLPLDVAGDDDCVAVNTRTLTSTMRLVVSPGREDDAVLSMPGGQSESPRSPHFADQHRSWRAKVASRLLP
jgi:penicillin amidase